MANYSYLMNDSAMLFPNTNLILHEPFIVNLIFHSQNILTQGFYVSYCDMVDNSIC